MQKKLLVFVLLLLMSAMVYAQDNYWKPVNYADIRLNSTDKIENNFSLKGESYFHLNKEGISTHLSGAPLRSNNTTSTITLEVPILNGRNMPFEMYKTNTMSPQLAANYPKINSYVGKSLTPGDGSILRITITPQGFYGMVLKPGSGQLFINPIDKNGQYYTVFNKANATNLMQQVCEVVGNDSLAEQIGDNEYQTFDVDDSTLRTYRLALACTGEYAQFHINDAGVGGGTTAQQKAAVLAAMVVSVDRVNSIYERDLAVSFQLVSNNDQIIYLNGATDPYTNGNAGAMINENQTVINNVIGFSNYDIGHVYGTFSGIGSGLAGLGVVCTNLKASGVTGTSTPVGDPFVVDFVSHEIGHQFGANHTQNNNCQRNSPTAVEPGSGNTIMGYAGICAPNVQNNSDAHFHQVSLNEMYNFVTTSFGANCATTTSIANSPPTVSTSPFYFIPYGTAFYLDATASDPDGDALTYNWEQLDNEISTQPPLASSTNGPNFRSLPSSTESRRYFPNFQDVLANNLTPTWEVIPSVARSMDFVVTVRDNNALGGQSSRDFSSVNFANVGPFQVTSQNTANINWLPGETRTITWDVAGTTANGINTSNVNILLSTDNGQTFTPLVSNTANDGIQDVTVPNVQSGFCRLMVEAVGNIFYALNTSTFAIDTNVSVTCNDYVNSSTVAIPDGVGPNQQGPAVSSVINIPDNVTNINDINITLDVTHTYISDLVFQLQAPNNDIIVLWGRNCNSEDGFTVTFNDDGAGLPAPGTNCANPLTGSYAPVDTNTDIATMFSNGTVGNWTLQFADFFNGDVGQLNSWEIEICSTTFSVEDNQLNDFIISPNPNNGVFNLLLTTALSNDAELNIYDFRGRLIENQELVNSSLSQQISLQKSYQTGVYLLEIVSNGVKSVNKLIIK